MALSFAGATSQVKSTGVGNSIVINVPTVTDGDLMLLSLISIGSSWTLTSGLTGWTPVAETVESGVGANAIIRMYSRVASSEPASYTPVLSSTARAAVVISAYRGQNVTPVHAFDTSTANVSDTALTSASVTTTDEDCWLVTVAGSRSTTTTGGWTTADGLDSERADVVGSGTSSATLAVYDSNRVLASGTYDRALTAGQTFNQVSSISVAIKPATTPISSDGFMGWGMPV